MFKSSILRSSPYKPSKEWTWNMFTLRFYTEWTPVYNFELVIEDLYRESKIPHRGLREMISEHRDNESPIIFPTHVLNSMDSQKLEMFQLDGKYLIPDTCDNKSVSNKASLTEEHKLLTSDNLMPVSDRSDLVHIDVTRATDLSAPSIHSWGVQNQAVLNITKEEEEEQIDKSTTYIEVLNSVPNRLKLAPFKPTPKHFELVSFDQVLTDGVGLTRQEIDQKGKQLSTCIWVVLLFAVSFSSMFCMAFLKLIIASIVMGGTQYSYLVSCLYLGAATFLSLVLYISYQHMFWQYSSNRFASIYDFYQDIKKHPIRMLPIIFSS
ncbi:hypothetical protein OCT63_19540 [Vibrio sp. RW]|uniref:hypothetical protein n=1 Tax=Vibrio sp. RW TaxID=2998833 RepID=UPI0022CD4D55|nr:hypothetical protein [Vibrio sp. RW]MDA0146423.1 hypothetical protein [Vibrio sp. RW]